jgi:hypothetical protein
MADNVDVVRDAKSVSSLPIDDQVKLPRQVVEAKARAEAFYAQQAQRPSEQAAPAAAMPEPPQGELPPAEPPAEQPPQPPEPVDAKPPPQDLREVEYANRYNHMRGRYEQEQRRAAAVEAQNAALRSELLRLQSLPPQEAPPAPPKLITSEDEANYGRDLIDFAKRAAEEAVGPKLSALEQENGRLRQAVAEQSRGSMTAALDAAVPTWRQVFANPRFTQWLNLPDVYSDRLRSQLLTEAANAGNSARVVKFYQGFLADEAATGQIDSGTPPSPRPAPARKAALSLETIATPGRGHPAGGTPSRAGNEKPILTRAQIAEFYSDVRKNKYAGREQQKMAEEAVIGAAVRDGRVIP